MNKSAILLPMRASYPGPHFRYDAGMRALLAISAPAVLATACITSSSGEAPTPQVVAQTVITCPACELIDVDRVIDGDTIDTSIGRVRIYEVDPRARRSVLL